MDPTGLIGDLANQGDGSWQIRTSIGTIPADGSLMAGYVGSRSTGGSIAAAAGGAGGAGGGDDGYGNGPNRRALAGLLSIGAAESGVWKLNPFQRGQQIEQRLGHNLPGNFPVIDRFENGLATSIKSIDLDATTYQSGSTLTRTLNGYVDKVAGFQGRTWAGVRIRGQDITGRALDLAIPHTGSAAQQAIISQTVKYGASRGVTVNVIPFP